MAVLFDLKGGYWKDPDWFVECVQKEARQDAASLGGPAQGWWGRRGVDEALLPLSACGFLMFPMAFSLSFLSFPSKLSPKYFIYS